MTKAKIIAIEGSDGSGKETQSLLVEKILKDKGYSVFRYAFPSYGTKQAYLTEEYLSGSFGDDDPKIASACFAMDRLITLKKDISAKLNECDYIVLDRYVKSNMIHQGRKLQGQEKLDFIKWVENLEYNVYELPREDIAFFLNMPPEYSLELVSKRQGKAGIKNDILENLDSMTQAHSNAMEIVDTVGMIRVDCVTEDGHIKTRDAIADELISIILK